MKVMDVTRAIEELAPLESALSWDNVGLLTGSGENEVTGVYLTLDVTRAAVEEAIQTGCNLIAAHHPLIFNPLKRVVTDDVEGLLIHTLITHNISVYAAHTNFDAVKGGLNDILAEAAGIASPRSFTAEELKTPDGGVLDDFGRVGQLAAPMRFGEFAAEVKTRLNSPHARYVGDLDKTVRTAAVVSGGGADHLHAARRAGADAFVSSDFKHHHAQYAAEVGLCLIDAGHFETENLFCGFMREFLSARFVDIKIQCSTSAGFFRPI